MALNWVSWLAKSPFKRHLVSQLGRPRGFLGRALGKTMNRSNLGMSRLGLAQLGLKPGDTAIEVGFGGGVALPLLLEAVGSRGKVVGVDRSQDMLDDAEDAFQAALGSAHLDLFHGELPQWPEGLPLADGILAVNVVYFWTEPEASVRTLAAALKPGGRLCLCFRPPEVAAVLGLDKAGFNTVQSDSVLAWMRAAGLEEARITSMPEGKFLAHAALAIKPN